MGFFSKLFFWRKPKTQEIKDKVAEGVRDLNAGRVVSHRDAEARLASAAYHKHGLITIPVTRNREEDEDTSSALPLSLLAASMLSQSSDSVFSSDGQNGQSEAEPVKFDSSLSDERLGSELSSDGIESILDSPSESSSSFGSTSSSSDSNSDWGGSSSSSSDWGSSSSSSDYSSSSSFDSGSSSSSFDSGSSFDSSSW